MLVEEFEIFQGTDVFQCPLQRVSFRGFANCSYPLLCVQIGLVRQKISRLDPWGIAAFREKEITKSIRVLEVHLLNKLEVICRVARKEFVKVE
jgi:hypothetical protein